MTKHFAVLETGKGRENEVYLKVLLRSSDENYILQVYFNTINETFEFHYDADTLHLNTNFEVDFSKGYKRKFYYHHTIHTPHGMSDSHKELFNQSLKTYMPIIKEYVQIEQNKWNVIS
jgi:hypothetical protein